jgi:hypothetical protein
LDKFSLLDDISLKEILNNGGVKISRATLIKMINDQLLRDMNRQKRVKWCNEYLDWAIHQWNDQLFGLFGTRTLQRPINFYDYDERIIGSAVETLESKDAIFYLFLDTKKVHKVCNNNIQFGHIIKLLPGLETVQLVGCSTSQNLDAAIKSTHSTPEKVTKKKQTHNKNLDGQIDIQ